MRRPDGKMSKKDRRALLAFGITPAEEKVSMADLLRQITPDRGPTITFTWSNSWNNAAPVVVGTNWYLAVDPNQQGGHAMMIPPGSYTVTADP